VVAPGEGRLDREHVAVLEWRGVEHGDPVAGGDVSRRAVCRRRRAEAGGPAADHGVEDAGVLRVRIEGPERERAVDDLRGAHVALQVHGEALRAKRLRIELAEQELLREVLGAEGDWRLAGARPGDRVAPRSARGSAAGRERQARGRADRGAYSRNEARAAAS